MTSCASLSPCLPPFVCTNHPTQIKPAMRMVLLHKELVARREEAEMGVAEWVGRLGSVTNSRPAPPV